MTLTLAMRVVLGAAFALLISVNHRNNTCSSVYSAMDPLTVSLLAVAAYAVYYYFKKQLSYFADRGVPYVPAWPVFGNMYDALFQRKHANDVVLELYNAHPDAKYIGVMDLMTPLIMLRDPELIKTITIKSFDSFPDHNPFVDVSIDPLMGGNLFNTPGDKWREARNLMTPAFTSSKMKNMHELMIECGRNFLKYVVDLPDSERKIMGTKDLFAKYTNDAIATCAFGISVDSLKDPNNDFYVLGKEATNVDTMTFKFLFARTFPRIMKWLKVRFIGDHIVKFFTNVIDNTVKTRDEKGISRPDMVQLMMNARGKETKHVKLDLLEMTVQAFTFFFGGFDTTSTQMCIIAHELAANPDVQKRLQAEIDEVMKNGKEDPTYEDIHSMLYLDAVFNESMRRHSQAGTLDRVCSKEFELPPAMPGGKPFALKPGMMVWVPAVGIHMDPKYYDEPEKFNPDRYYEKKVTINDVTNLGFGIGPRSCIGNRFAVLETKILFFYLLSKFNLKPTPKTNIPMKYNKSTFAIKDEGGFWLEFEPRLKSRKIN